ncbi:hypothetical protein GCM10015535_67080 [Streptomyces gelaticus]|uniref:Lipoprotein n=2 Tax=Streptomyces gelaticus TaxID=285446 RepID=A0ABQ2WBB0_9ACTN|nr:hypothetical protein GCM10015535_67080 [Streptomyces gelaticus]
MNRRVWRTILLPTVACLLLAGCGGEDTAGTFPAGVGEGPMDGDVVADAPKPPQSPEASYRAFVRGLYAGDGPAVCRLTGSDPSAQSRLLRSFYRALDLRSEGRSPLCEDAVTYYVQEKKLTPIPEGKDIPIYGKVKYTNDKANLGGCYEKPAGGYDRNLGGFEWNKESDGWVIDWMDFTTGCGG